ncbi:MAG: vanadium-dependent haloperoxidase [Saprospiraceae bacterium]
MRTLFSKISFFLFAVFLLTITSCTKDEDKVPENYLGKKSYEYDSKIVSDYYAHTLNLITTTGGYTPPVVSRNLGYIGVALYEALRPGNPDYKTMDGQLTQLSNVPLPENDKEYYWPAVANFALARINTLLFPRPESKKNLFDSIHIIKNYYQIEHRKAGVEEEVLVRSETFGEKMADAIFQWSTTDLIGHEAFRKNFPASYIVPTGTGFWVPTGPQLIPLQPYWGTVRAFVPGSITFATPPDHIPFSTTPSSDFYVQANIVYQTGKTITPEQKLIALYWADGGNTVTPPGHSIAIAKQLMDERGEKLDRAAEIMMRVGIATADAFICCWRCKYVYNLMRPVTYIQKYIDPSWKTLIATPPFPEYTSGHSSQAGAAAYVLTELFGQNYSFTDKTHQFRKDIDGKPRKFNSFTDFAQEAAVSRLYGGIHYPMGNEMGFSSGQKIGISHNLLNIK